MSVRSATQSPPTMCELLEAWRLSLGLDHTRFAARLGLDQGNWSRMRRGLQGITRETMRAILRQAEEPWRTALALAWLREHLGVAMELTARPSVGEPMADGRGTGSPRKV